MKLLVPLIANHADWLVRRVLQYAGEYGYSRHTGPLADAWRQSLSRLSKALLSAIQNHDRAPELGPDNDQTWGPVASFAVREARLCRKHGMTLGESMGFLKGCRQSTIDLVLQAGFGIEDQMQCQRFVERCLDRLEIAFCGGWDAPAEPVGTKDEKQTEDAEYAPERGRTLFEYAPDGCYLSDLKGTFIDGNRAAEELVGYKREDLIGKNFLKLKLLSPGQIPKATMLLARNALGKATGPDEFVLTQKDGCQIPVEIRTFPVEMQGQSLVLGIARDISQRKQTEAALRESEEKYRLLVENAHEAIVVVQDGMVIFMNDKAPEIGGYTKQEVIARPFLEYVHPEDREMMVERQKRRSQGDNNPFLYPCRFVDSQGEVKWLEIHSAPFLWEGKPATLNFLKDVTERKEMEQELIHLERMRAQAEISMGVSHNLNNLLTCIQTPAQLIQMLSNDDRILEEAAAIDQAVQRATDLIRRLRRSVKRGTEPENLKPIDVNEVVQEVAQVMRSHWEKEQKTPVKLVTKLKKVPAVRGTWYGLYDVLHNLLVNAAEALSKGGSITIGTKAVAKGIRLTVSDTGVGMDEETRRRVFEAFFTTKADVGAGLGLTTVYGTITRWGGVIKAKSSPGKGTTFTVLLPTGSDSNIRMEGAGTSEQPCDRECINARQRLKEKIGRNGRMFARELLSTFQKFELRLQELSAIRRIVEALTHLRDTRKVMAGVIDAILDETNAENCSLMVFNPETQALNIKAARGQSDSASSYYDAGSIPQPKFRIGEGVAGWVVQNKKPVFIPEVSKDDRFVDLPQDSEPVGSMLCLPLMVDTQILGVVNMSHPNPHAFSAEDQRLMTIIADQVAIALNSVRIFEGTQQLNTSLEVKIADATRELQRVNLELKEDIARRKQTE